MKIQNTKRLKTFSEINITPLTDVAFCLLLIFMIATPLLVQGSIGVKLPQAATTEIAVEKNIAISITADKRVFVEGKEINLPELPGLLKQFLIAAKSRAVVVNADRSVEHGKVVQVLDIARQCGATKLLVSTIPRKHGEWDFEER